MSCCALDPAAPAATGGGGKRGLSWQVELVAGGYLSRHYADSFGEWGEPWPLRRSGGWALLRAIPGSDLVDAMGCYPLLACRHWPGLGADLEELGGRAVAFAAVIDPLAPAAESDLRAAFPDLLRPFKEHFVVELRRPGHAPAARHRRNARRAHARVAIELVAQPAALGDEWARLYAYLIRRHAITGLRAFSRASFEKQLRAPGMRAIRAVAGGSTVGITLWAEHGGNAYYHLGAQDEAGYARGASFAMFEAAIEWFRGCGCELLDLGGGVGVAGGSDGLAQFKRGWASTTMPARFGGRVLDAAAYARLAATRPPTAYFPAYRQGEFA